MRDRLPLCPRSLSILWRLKTCRQIGVEKTAIEFAFPHRTSFLPWRMSWRLEYLLRGFSSSTFGIEFETSVESIFPCRFDVHICLLHFLRLLLLHQRKSFTLCANDLIVSISNQFLFILSQYRQKKGWKSYRCDSMALCYLDTSTSLQKMKGYPFNLPRDIRFSNSLTTSLH